MTAITVSEAGMKSMVTRTIEQANSTLMVRELFQNALEATSKQTSGKKQIKIRDTDPAWFGLTGYSKNKFGIYNTGTGLSAVNLRKATDLSSSIGKTQGVHNNFGEGAKVSALPVNKSGMIWASCNNKEVNMVVLRLAVDPLTKEERYERQDFQDGNGGTTDVINITSMFSDDQTILDTFGTFTNPSGLDNNDDWTYIVLCGNTTHQNTTENPYGAKNQGGSWALNEIYKRFANIPGDVEVKSEIHSRGKAKDVPFNTVFEILKNKSIQHPDKVQLETISIPVFSTQIDINDPVQNGTINITYVYDGPWGRDGNETHITSWVANAATCPIFSGIIYKDEFYDVRGGNPGSSTWQVPAKECGVLYGYEYFRVFVHIPQTDDIVTDRYRQYLTTKSITMIRNQAIDKKPILFTDYKHEIYNNMPEWFKEKMKQFAPKPMNLDDVHQELQDLMERVRHQVPAERDKTGTNGTVSKDITRKKPKSGASNPPVPRQGLSGGSGLVAALAGKQKMIQQFPHIEVLNEHTIKGAALSPTFKYKAAEYAIDRNILFINATYPAVIMIKEDLLSNFLAPSEEVEKLANDISISLITKLVGSGLVYGLVKQGKPGYEDDFEKAIDSACLSTHADKWVDQIEQAKKRFEKETKVLDLKTNLDNYKNSLSPDEITLHEISGVKFPLESSLFS